MKIKKILIATVSTIAIATSAIAVEVKSDKHPVVSDLEVKIGGYAEFKAGYRNQNHLEGDEKNVSANRKDFAFYSRAALVADVSNEVNGVTYGGKITLVPTAKRKGGPAYEGSHIYMSSNFGKIEAGSPFSAASMMLVDGSTIAVATFDGWSDFANSAPAHLMQGSKIKPSFAAFSEFFLDSRLTAELDTRPYSGEPPRSIVYYTPKFELAESTKVQVGISYTPDSGNTGADNANVNSGTTTYTVSDTSKFVFNNSVKDAVTAGITLEQNLADGVDVQVALTGEHGTAAGKVEKYTTGAADEVPTKLKLSNLRTYNIGTVLNIGNFSYAAGFGSLGNSLTTPEFHQTGRKTTYYTGSVAYKQGPFAASVSYFKSDRFKNTVDAVSIGTAYTMAPGFKPYAEISGFSLKGKPEYDSAALVKKETRGAVVQFGAKLSL